MNFMNLYFKLPASEFAPFVMETAIYDASKECIACATVAMEDSNDVIRLSNDLSHELAEQFRTIWKRYMHCNP